MNRAALPIRVDRNSPVPLYFQVAQHLEQMIESGELPMGTQLDNEAHLAGQLGLSKPTMRRALEYLVGRGLLVRKRGIGTQLARNAAYEAVSKGQMFCGPIDVLGTAFDACYNPIRDSGGKVIGVSYIGHKK